MNPERQKLDEQRSGGGAEEPKETSPCPKPRLLLMLFLIFFFPPRLSAVVLCFGKPLLCLETTVKLRRRRLCREVACRSHPVLRKKERVCTCFSFSRQG